MAFGETYEEFVEKFKPKKTTDDCYTPENVYEVIKEWAVERYNLQGREIVRPFWPGADFRSVDYPENCVVIDNPPFSILSKICREYRARHIDYFLFAPTLTLFSTNSGNENYIVCDAGVTYENGAVVNTSFLTNLGSVKINVAGDLTRAIEHENQKNVTKAKKPTVLKYDYPQAIATAAKLGKIAKRGIRLEIKPEDTAFIRALDAQKPRKKGLYGAGFLLSEKAAAEKAAAEEVTIWELSTREKQIIQRLGAEVSEDE